jgi:hypothetical protein
MTNAQLPEVSSGLKTPVFYWTAEGATVPSIIDMAKEVDGVMRGTFSGQTLDEISVRCHGAQLGELDEVIAQKEASLISQPTSITEEDYWDALEQLPPNDWHTTGHYESFKMSEHLSGRITSIYCKTGDQYFTFNDVCTLSHQEIVTKINSRKTQTDENAQHALQ